MSAVGPIDVVALIGEMRAVARADAVTRAIQPAHTAAQSFADFLTQGVGKVNDRLIAADRMVVDFVLNDDVPVHRVTFALEEARMSLEVMLQLRGRLVEGYQQLMNMQL